MYRRPAYETGKPAREGTQVRKSSFDHLGITDVIRVGMERKSDVDDRGRSQGVLTQTGTGSRGITRVGKPEQRALRSQTVP